MWEYTKRTKEVLNMPTSQESMDIKKAMAYDLLIILKSDETKSYTAEDIEKIIQSYIAGLAQK